MNSFRLVQRKDEPGGHDAREALARLERAELPMTHDFRHSAPSYRLSSSLETAINTALAIGAPLLLTGEPGTGKTQVAYYLGWYFGIEVFPFSVKSTSTADDLKFDFDAVGHLRAAYHPDLDVRRERREFLDKKALWLAYEQATTCVLLIDEIDKAPRDFPNDLLHELDRHEFRHPFEDRSIRPRCGRPPIVIITSNVERRLPDAFLRRCIYHHIEMTEQLVRDAVSARIGSFPALTPEAREAALGRFWSLRDKPLRKRPSTAELLAWLAILSARQVPASEISGARLRDLPALGALVKDGEDVELLCRG